VIDWKPAWNAHKAQSRIASDFRAWRAIVRVARAMSPAEARRILDLPVSPSEEDIRRAWKLQTIKNHPDRGGSTEAMVDVNVAAETLLRQGVGTAPSRSNWEDVRRRTEEAEERAREDFQKRRDEEKRKQETPVPEPPGHSYSSVVGKGSGIDWKLVSEPTYRSEWVRDDESGSPSAGPGTVYQVVKHAYIAFGLRDGKGFVLGLIHTLHKRGDYSYSATAEAWDADLSPLRGAPVRGLPAALKKWSEMQTPGWRPRAKWHVLDGDLPSEDQLKKLYGKGGISLKEALLGLGISTGGKAAKPAVQMGVEQKPRAEYLKIKESLPSRGGDTWKLYNFTLTVNGKGRVLEEREVQGLVKNYVIFGLFGYAYWEFMNRRPLNLHKSRKYRPAELFSRIHEALDPGWLKDAMAEAVTAYGGTVKTARYTYRRAV
jgi:hypothetical protein